MNELRQDEKNQLLVNIQKSNRISQQQIDDMPFDIKIFTDGACEPNPGEAGTGLAVYQNNEISELWYGLYQSSGTNNTAELHGLKEGLLLAREKLSEGFSIAIFCDSKYFNQAYALYEEINSKIMIYHVNGHAGIEGNELADRMSIVAIDTKKEELCLFGESPDIIEILALRSGEYLNSLGDPK